MRSLLSALAGLALLWLPAPSSAQVSSHVEVRQGAGRAVVANPGTDTLRVSVALWESDESGGAVELVAPARATLWPVAFDLPPGERQVIRLVLDEGAYEEGRLLRLETRMLPLSPAPTATDGTAARFILATRILSKVLVH